MQKICAELGESVFLSVFDRAAVVTLAEEESRASLRVVSEVGARLPAALHVAGKAVSGQPLAGGVPQAPVHFRVQGLYAPYAHYP